MLGRRRVPGLRREELAQLAGVSPDYYVRLEQGRGHTMSDAVLDAVARVLRLTGIEREHLVNLARTTAAARSRARRQRIRLGVQVLLDMMQTVPAFVLGRRLDVLAAEAVAFLRLDSGRHPGDPQLAALVGELSLASPEFARLWAAQGVRDKTSGRKLLHHPVVGELDLAFETLVLPGESDQLLVTYTAPPGGPAYERLQLLASWTVPFAEGVRASSANRRTPPA